MIEGIAIRSFESRDQAACARLYQDGLLGGAIAENDTGIDIDDINGAYMVGGGSHFWVAVDAGGSVVGMIGVQQHESGEGEIRRLRVASDFQRRGIGAALLTRAVEYCRENGILKLTLDTWIDRDHALGVFKRFNFVHQRTRESNGKQSLTFYLDIYGSEDQDKDEPSR
jgi:ribosomal protein S18 acetylase RimI-like enzyme